MNHSQLAWRCIQVSLFLLPILPTWGGLLLLFTIAFISKQDFETWRKRPLHWGFALLSGWLIITCFFAFKPEEAFLGLANFLPFFWILTTYSLIIQTPNQLRRLAWLMIIPSLPIAILGLGQLVFGWATPEALQILLGWHLIAGGNPTGRMASVFMYANVLAAYLMIVLILGLGLWVHTWKALRSRSESHQARQLGFLTLVIVFDAIALILTSSRNAWAIAFLAFLTFALYLGWRWLILGMMAAASSILWASFGPTFGRDFLRRLIPAYFWARLSGQMYPNQPIPLMRTTQWQFAGEMIQQRSWMGWGLRNFTPLYQAEMEVWLGHPHNLYIMLTAETGIIATLLFFSLVGWILAKASTLLTTIPPKKSFSWEQDSLMVFTYLVAFGGCILFNCLDVTLFDFRVNTLGWILLSAIAGVGSHSGKWRSLELWQKTSE